MKRRAAVSAATVISCRFRDARKYGSWRLTLTAVSGAAADTDVDR